MKTYIKNKTIYGDRVCPNCKGLVSGHVLRSNYGIRKKYYCSEYCVKGFLHKKESKKIKFGKESLSDKSIEEVLRYMIKFLEHVYVRPKKITGEINGN